MKRQFVGEGQYTGKYVPLRMVDNSRKAVLTAKMCVEIPYRTGEVETMYMPDVCDLIIGNIYGAKSPKGPQP